MNKSIMKAVTVVVTIVFCTSSIYAEKLEQDSAERSKSAVTTVAKKNVIGKLRKFVSNHKWGLFLTADACIALGVLYASGKINREQLENTWSAITGLFSKKNMEGGKAAFNDAIDTFGDLLPKSAGS